MFFAMIDYDEAADIFAGVRIKFHLCPYLGYGYDTYYKIFVLQLRKSSVPVFLHFPAKGKLKKEDEIPIQT